MTIKEWIEKQKEIESMATPGPWTRSLVSHYDQTITYIEQENSDKFVIETASGISKENTRIICEYRNNYRNLLEALEIAVSYLESIERLMDTSSTKSIWLAGNGVSSSIKDIKKKLGID